MVAAGIIWNYNILLKQIKFTMSRAIKFQLFLVRFFINCQNLTLAFFQFLLFPKNLTQPGKILIFKVGNIGDIVCAVPALLAVRRAYPQAKITLLTSAGKQGALGAKELLTGVWYLDELKVYYSEEVTTFKQKSSLVKELKSKNYDLFIQCPDDLAGFGTLWRNLIFAKAIGVKSAFGFKVRTIQLFKKTQVDYLFNQTETESLLEILKENKLKVERVEFDFNITSARKEKAERFLREKWLDYQKQLIVAVSAGGKRETNQWPLDRFAQITKYLQNKQGAKIVIIGGGDDIHKGEIIKEQLREENISIAAGQLDILETMALLKNCSFLISNSTGPIHLAAAINLPCVGLYSVRDVFGRWFPYGQGHQILFHRFLGCNYQTEECIKKSIDLISVEEVIAACERIIQQIVRPS